MRIAVSKRDDARRNHEGAKIGVGIIGTVGWANTHAVACKVNPHAEIVGLAEIREGMAELFAGCHDINVPLFSDYRELLAMDGLDAVIITTSNDVTCADLDRGCRGRETHSLPEADGHQTRRCRSYGSRCQESGC